MDETLLEKVLEAKKSHETALVGFFNDGKIRKDDNSNAKRVSEASQDYSYYCIGDLLCDATASYARETDIDCVSLGLSVGLLFNKADVDDNNMINENAQPLSDIVRYYTFDFNGYLNGKNIGCDYVSRYMPGRQGFVNYNKLVATVKKGGLKFEGPETFEEFKDAILSGEKFDIVVSADLKEKEEAKDKPKSLLKSLFK